MRCCRARTLNLNQPITYYPAFENTMNATTLPILDLAATRTPRIKRPSRRPASAAARDIGFFYLINHGVDDALQYEVQRQSQRFFALDEAQKQQSDDPLPHFRGYNRAALRADARPS